MSLTAHDLNDTLAKTKTQVIDSLGVFWFLWLLEKLTPPYAPSNEKALTHVCQAALLHGFIDPNCLSPVLGNGFEDYIELVEAVQASDSRTAVQDARSVSRRPWWMLLRAGCIEFTDVATVRA